MEDHQTKKCRKTQLDSCIRTFLFYVKCWAINFVNKQVTSHKLQALNHDSTGWLERNLNCPIC